jgi:hypothetical protein
MANTGARCRYWLAGTCRFTAETCRYEHPKDASEAAAWRESVSKEPSRKCRHFIRKGRCDFGSRCGFRHPRDEKQLREWRAASTAHSG